MQKVIKRILIIISLLFIAFAGICIYGAYDYIQGAAKLEYIGGKENKDVAINVKINEEYEVTDFVQIIRGVNPEINYVTWDESSSDNKDASDEDDGYIITNDGTGIIFTREGEGTIAVTAMGTRTEGYGLHVPIHVTN